MNSSTGVRKGFFTTTQNPDAREEETDTFNYIKTCFSIYMMSWTECLCSPQGTACMKQCMSILLLKPEGTTPVGTHTTIM